MKTPSVFSALSHNGQILFSAGISQNYCRRSTASSTVVLLVLLPSEGKFGGHLLPNPLCDSNLEGNHPSFPFCCSLITSTRLFFLFTATGKLELLLRPLEEEKSTLAAGQGSTGKFASWLLAQAPSWPARGCT